MFLEPDPFLNELHKMYERHGSKGTVYITMKRSNLKPRKTKKAPPPPEDYRCLIRAGDGGKKNISTTVPITQHAKFANSINVIMKAHMGALKKKEKEKKKDKEKEQQH